MRPTRHTDPSEDELIAHIKDSLMMHEEAYAPGAWERFREKEKKPKGLIFWIGGLSSAAAVFLISIGLYMHSGTADKKQTVTQTTVKTEPLPEIPAAAQTAAGPGRTDKGPKFIKAEAQPLAGTRFAPSAKNGAVPQEVDRFTAEQAIVADGPELNKSTGTTTHIPKPVQDKINPAAETQKPTILEFLNKESLSVKEDKKSLLAAGKSGKWEMGLIVAPSFGNTKKLNMGYGMSMGYALTNKVSLSSGISYNELSASKSVSTPATMSIAGETRNLSAVEASVTGIDVPLEIRYHFSKSLYANVGVSAFAVLNQKQSNSYIRETLVERSAGLAADNKDVISTFVVAEKTTEEAPRSEISEDHYLGFYNFSLGYKQKVSKSKSISIEPFMKVPMKEIAKENLRLIGTGVRLKFDF